ncbi:hypothetical protein F3I27_21395 [Pantoea sp. Bo_2]|uniref:hypothetical protein n=1 Tax=unclassified Pantoea TaxID=2630326 RepID=UPI001232BAF5|nr:MULTISPECIES: hypothetical protein [unclassified Pantoea]KAA5938650.1 hypothetical protein F3I57_20535 [Pantoea sp. VH_3]KAA5946824.1 hypothetical protein F3I56_21485 [Pantoea sp. VH_25]KAA5952054.1 hypothetical protein F3I55_18380 [Pantoea sp. VH_24]KAA5953416.1 hypothetical protein F3I53_22270 [Pantoea sp. VH_16]KAA5961642.1 hypothetical protein F3I54_19220 [Pantoea sp. VH_18]
MIKASTIQRTALDTLRSDTIISSIAEQAYVAPSAEEVSTAVTEFVDHLTLSDEASVRQTCGSNFDVIAAAFTDKSGVVAKALTDKVISDDKEAFRADVQTYADHLQYKHGIDDGQTSADSQSQQ